MGALGAATALALEATGTLDVSGGAGAGFTAAIAEGEIVVAG
jgi:adhesin HecA-like repeat protein